MDVARPQKPAVGHPDAGSFALLQCQGRLGHWNAASLAKILLRDHGVAVTPSPLLYSFGDASSDFIRIALARPTSQVKRLIEALDAIVGKV